MSTTEIGSITVVSGPMFSGKSSFLQLRIRRALIAGRAVQVFKPELDTRPGYGGEQFVASHDGVRVDAEPVAGSAEILGRVRHDTEVVAVDEVQFLDGGIVAVAQKLADEGKEILLAGIDQDFRARPFGSIGDLMAVAEHIVKLDAVCLQCGRPATRNQRLVNGEPAPADGPTVLVGAQEHYEARCRACHVVPEPRRSAMRTVS